jgi:Domain of unknown function (DUF4331)
MSSHREAPAISKDAVADSTDLYAFVSPDDPSTVTIVANYLPGEAPFGGPNFYEFGDDVLYKINIDNDADGKPDIVYEFEFRTEVSNKGTFLYNVGPITSLDSAAWIRKQFYTVTRVHRGKRTVLGRHLACPPCNIGPGSTSNYGSLASAAIHKIGGGHVFAGQRLDPFYVDLGSIFDLGDLRPLNMVGPLKLAATHGVDSLSQMNVQSIALKVPKTALTRDGSKPTNGAKAASVIGVWTSASRRKSVIHNGDGTTTQMGPYVQVSRLGNPLVNEAVIPMGLKDGWNADVPARDSQYAKFVAHPELQSLLNVLYKGAFPNLAALASSGKPRADLEAVLLTGIPSGIVPGFQNNTGSTQADQLRLNMAIPPAKKPNAGGLAFGDAAGYPNGRRPADDVVTIVLRAVAGLLYPLIDKTYKVDKAVSLVSDGLGPKSSRYLSHFPYLGTPASGYDTKPLAA